jgi:hypothetical protein
VKNRFLWLILSALLLSGCAPAPAAVPEPAPTLASILPPPPADTPAPTPTSDDNWEVSLTQIPTVSRGTPVLPEGYIYLQTWCNDQANAVTTFSTVSSIAFKYGWTASTMEQIDGFLDTVLLELTLDGEAVVFDGAIDVVHNQEQDDYTLWFYKLIGPMEPGTHKMEQKMTFTQPYEDGTETYGPGTDFEISVMSCDFTVE